MTAQHTPGPWVINRTHSPARIYSAMCSGSALAMVYLTDPDTRKRTSEFEANATLIHAAPDLFAALKAMIETDLFLHDHPQKIAAYKAALQAIAKASTP